MAEDYRISLGVDLDTSDLKKKIESLDNKHSIKLGVDLKVNDIRDRISAYNKNTNNAKLKLGISLDTDDLKKQINQLDLGGKGKGKGVAIPVNTASLEESFREVKGIITDIKNSLGTLDNGNMKSLVSSVNQIASALERATDESNGLLASLNALANKDFSFNIGISTKNDPISKNILYGDKVKEIFPQLQQQKNAIINALQQYYRDIYAAELKAQKSGNKRKIGAKSVSDDPLSVISYVTGMDIGSAWALLERTDAPLKTTGKNKDNYRDRINEVNDLINSMIKGAKAQGINLDPIINEFSMSSDELIKSANDIQTGTNEVQDSFERLKKVMGGGIDADGLGQVLEPLLKDIGEIKKAFESLSSIGTIDGLTTSFKELSEVLEKLTSNIAVAKQNLNNIGGNLDSSAGNTNIDIENLEQDLKQATNAAEQASDAIRETVNETKKLNNVSIDISDGNIDDIKNALRNINIDDSDIEKATKELNELNITAKNVSATFRNDQLAKIEINGIETSIDGLNRVITATTNFGEKAEATSIKYKQAFDKIADTARKAKIELADTGAKGFEYRIESMRQEAERFVGTSGELREAIDRVDTAFDNLKTADEVGDVRALSKAYDDLNKAIGFANSQLTKSKQFEAIASKDLKLDDDRQVFQSRIDAWLTKNSAAAKDFGAAMLDLKAKAENCDRTELNHLEKEFKQLDYAAEKAGKKMMSIGDQIKTKFKEYSAYFSVAEVFMYVEQGLRSMFEQVKLIDSAMTELKKVTNETNESYDRFLTNAASRAKEIGTTIDGLVSSTADFARLGYGFEDAQGLAEVANIYAVVGDEIEGVEGATESLVSTLAAFKSEMNGLSDSEFALSIVDKMNEVSNNFSISSGGIGEALKRSASSMQAANNSLDETIALITAANEVTQDPETVGQAFKTISMRIRGAKTELEDAGESTEGMAESTATLRKEIMALSGVDIMLNEDTFKSTYQIMDELSQKWEGLSDIAQASIIELVAGKHRGNVMASLMSNFDTARSALETSLNSSGSAMAEHSKWSKSLEARINSLSASWQALSQTFLQSDFLKGALDGVIGLIDGVTKLIDTFGTLPTLITAFSTVQSFRGKGFFKVIEDDAVTSGKRMTNVFSQAFSSIKQTFSESFSFDAGFKAALDDDVAALNNYISQIKSGVSTEEAFTQTMREASVEAQNFAKTMNVSTIEASKFETIAKQSKITDMASSFKNVRGLINEYNTGLQTCGLSQEEFLNAVGKSNGGFARYLSTVGQGNATMKGYVTSLIGAKAATIGLQIATTALNAVIGMGIGALVSIVISGITKWINAEEDLAEKVEEVTSKFKEQHEELRKLKGNYDTTNESSMVSRYAKLSKGVDNLGRNLSLTSEEYSEYQSVVNQIADQIPSLVSGYDSQGNALLSCKGNVEELTEAYEKLIHLQNQEILTQNNADIEKNWKNTLDNSNRSNWEDFLAALLPGGNKVTDMDVGSIEALKKIYNGNYSASEINKLLSTVDGESFRFSQMKIAKYLKDAGIEGITYGMTNTAWKTEEFSEILADALESEPEKVKGVIDTYYAQFDGAIAEYKTKATALLSEAFDISSKISGLEYGNISEELQDITYQVVNSLDFDFFNKLSESGKTIDEWTKEFLDQLNSINETDASTIETAFNLKTQFNDGEISYGEYVKGIEKAKNIIDGLELDEEVKNTIKLNFDDKEIKTQYNHIRKYLKDFYDNRDTRKMSRYEEYDYKFKVRENDKKVEEFLNNLTADELTAIIDIKTEIDWENSSVEDIRKQIEDQVRLNEALNFTIAIDVEAESVELLNAAMAESVSGVGLSSESIAALKSRYSELASEGYDLSAMFEETSNGIHLNRKAVSELEQEYAKQKLSETNDNLKVLKDKYDELTDEINNASDASERASLYVEQQSIVQKINDLSTLASQYQGLTSAYNAWLNAEEAGSERDMYENIIEGFEAVGDEISRGWIDDGTIKFLELLTGQTDLASKSGRELKEIYDSLNNTIGNSGYSISDFFTVDEDGNSTNTGVYNFLETVENFESQLGDVIKRGEDGSIIGFDFEVAGGDKAIAEVLGVSEELVQIMVRAADDAGFVVNIDGAYTQLADLKTEAEAARDSLITLKRDGLESLQDVDVAFDLEATGNDLIKEQEKAINLLNKFRKEDGTIDLSITGAQEALDIAEYLTIRIDDLTEPKYMQVDASNLEEELQEPIEKMQEFERLSKEKHLLTLTGDTTKLAETEAKMDEIAQYLDDIDDKEVQAKLGITGLTKEEIAEKLEKGEIELDAELSIDVQMSDDLKDMRLMMMNQLGLVSNEEVKLKIGFDIDDSVVDKLTDEQKQVVVEYLVNDEDVKNYTPEQKEALVKYIADGGSLDGFTPEEKEAFVNYLVDGGNVEGYTPEDKKAFAKYLVDGGDPANYQPPSKQQEVKADLDSSEPDNYQPDEKTQSVTAKLNSSAVDNYKPPEKEMTIWATIKKKASELWDWITGGGGVDGTAHVDGTAFANGTTGRTFKQGNWGTKDSGVALGGEEAPELLVRNGRWHLIGERGAEFFGYKKGDINK